MKEKTFDDKYRLSLPGWGLATTFHIENPPFKIEKIKLAAVAYYTMGIQQDYDSKFIRIQILDKQSRIIWSEYIPWSQFRGEIETDLKGLPKAIWQDISTGGVIVNDDFTVEITSVGKTYWEGDQAFDYFAVACEKIGNCGNSQTNSFISECGKRADPWITLYDQYGSPTCFNLCIRIEGIN